MNSQANARINVDFINPFISSIGTVLNTMANLDGIEAGKPSVKKDDSSLGDVSGLINMNGKPVSGSLAITFSKSLIAEIHRRMLGETITEINADIEDLVGEITNMASGDAKRDLSTKGFNFGLSRPKVVSGKGHDIKHPLKGPKIIVPFKTQWGDFFVETSFRGNTH